MGITADDVARLGALARIQLTPQECQDLAPELNVILESVRSVSEVAGPDVPTLAIRPDGPAGRAVDDALAVAGRRGIVPWTIGGMEIAARGRSLTVAADVPEPLTPLAYVLPGFLVAEAAARARGHDPDAPTGLSKVTRTR